MSSQLDAAGGMGLEIRKAILTIVAAWDRDDLQFRPNELTDRQHLGVIDAIAILRRAVAGDVPGVKLRDGLVRGA